MKHLVLLCLFLGITIFLPAQFLTSGGTTKATPALGIGDNADSNIQLKVNGNSSRSGLFAIASGSNKFGVYARSDNATCTGLAAISLNGTAVKATSTNGIAGVFIGEVEFRETGGSQDAYVQANFDDPDYRLYVDKGIQTGRIKTLASLADYVFEPGYTPMPLVEVEQYVWTHHHLPGVISQQAVDTEGGVDLTAFTVQLQEKLEELYLHAIEMDKRIQNLEVENQVLRVQLGEDSDHAQTSKDHE